MGASRAIGPAARANRGATRIKKWRRDGTRINMGAPRATGPAARANRGATRIKNGGGTVRE
ncbi:hypothetical protein [Sporosarcina jiandibaonis]|uniref:hypothetical protein n=1 Tax=Sporosarcina jiandibaonis TaxID=2715535 RepID=UPI001553E2F6|nr:hypothetical protein [Sporosarcina jiandibaonis]